MQKYSFVSPYTAHDTMLCIGGSWDQKYYNYKVPDHLNNFVVSYNTDDYLFGGSDDTYLTKTVSVVTETYSRTNLVYQDSTVWALSTLPMWDVKYRLLMHKMEQQGPGYDIWVDFTAEEAKEVEKHYNFTFKGPGVVWSDKPKKSGSNPCAEQSYEHMEMPKKTEFVEFENCLFK